MFASLVPTSRVPAHIAKCTATPSLVFVRYKGAKAGPAKGKKIAQGFKGNRKGGKQQEVVQKRPSRLGRFTPLSPSQLPPLDLARPELNVPTFHPETLTNSAIGKAMQFQISDNSAIRRFGVPKNILVENRLLSKPCSVVRDATISLINTLDGASRKTSAENRWILTGSKGCGKSFLLLQAVEYAVSKDWMVMYIPRGVALVNSSTAYIYDPRTQTYLQPDASFQLLQRFLSVNEPLLKGLSTQKAFVSEAQTVEAGIPLRNLIEIGLDDPSLAPAVLSSLMEELSLQTQFPVLLAVDDVQALYGYSMYREPYSSFLRSYHLSIPRLLLEYASGRQNFARGAVLGALSTAHTKFKLTTELAESLGLPLDRPAGPYSKRFPEYIEYARGLRPFTVPEQLSVNEAASLFELWSQDGALHQARNDDVFLSKYTESGGNARNFVWRGLLASLSL